MKLLSIQESINLEGIGGPMLLIFVVLFIVLTLIILIKRYKRCPSDRILVVYGKVEADNLPNVSMVVQPL